jgi:ABC-2 type transport system ATP-binding protein
VNIELTEITRSFGKNKMLNGVSLEAGPGVFGPNGAGKTSLLRRLATILPLSAAQS